MRTHPSALASIPPGSGARQPSATRPTQAGTAPAAVEVDVDTRYLETLLGYNARRAALHIIEVFLRRMAPYGLRPVDFSVLSVIAHNPGITSRQLCGTLNVLPPNFVGLLAHLEKRALVQRQPHPRDKRALALQLTASGKKLMHEAEQTAQTLEVDASQRLSTTERATLIRLLQKIYLNPAPG